MQLINQVKGYFYVNPDKSVNPYNKELAAELYNKVSNIDGNGWADKINRGEMDLYQEDSNDAVKGILREITYGGSSTGGIMAVRGVPSTEWDLIKIIITTAGTFTVGSASTVKYTSYTGNDTYYVLETNPIII